MTARWGLHYGAAAALAVSVGVCTPSAEGSRLDARAAPPSSVRVGALTLTVPHGFDRHIIRLRGHPAGVLVTDYPVRPNSPTLTKGVFPPNRVALALGRAQGPASQLRRLAVPSLHLPFSLTQLQGPQHRQGGTVWNGFLRFHGTLYVVSFWVGRTAPSRDRTPLLQALTRMRSAP